MFCEGEICSRLEACSGGRSYVEVSGNSRGGREAQCEW